MNSHIPPRLMLFARITLFALFQAAFALGFYLAGSPQAWQAGADWWLFGVALADLTCLVLLARLLRREGKRYSDLLRIDRAHVKGDLLAIVIFTVLSAPLTYFPNVWLGEWLFGNSAATLDLIVRPLPLWAAVAGMLAFSLGQGLTELPTYFGYIMPRLRQQGLKPWLAAALPAVMLSLQHIAVPLLWDGRFIAWRALMFLPFALFCALILHFRPRLMPYMVIVHILMDAGFAAMFLDAAV